MEGTVKWYNLKKGYGFIKGEDGQDYFVHLSALGGAMLRENDVVGFDAVDTDRGKQAQNVKLLQKGSEREGGEKKTSKRGKKSDEDQDDFEGEGGYSEGEESQEQEEF